MVFCNFLTQFHIQCLKILFGFHKGEDVTFEQLQTIVAMGLGPDMYDIGDQISTTWNDGSANHTLDMDIASMANAVRGDGATKPAMVLQSHYGIGGLQFDASEAIWYCSSALAAGQYCFSFAEAWGSNIAAGDAYRFTLTKQVPIGGQIVIGVNNNIYNWNPLANAPQNWRVYTFSSATSVTPIETVTLTSGTGGTNLGALSKNTRYGSSGLNNLERAGVGYPRWSQSGLRQWLNSDAAAGAWWQPQNVYDRPPQHYTTMPGFLHGLDADVINAIMPVQNVCALNPITDIDIGTSETVVDRVFIPAAVNEYVEPRNSIAEGEAWPIWVQRIGTEQPIPMSKTITTDSSKLDRYLLTNHSTKIRTYYRSSWIDDVGSICIVYNNSNGSWVWGTQTSAVNGATPCFVIGENA